MCSISKYQYYEPHRAGGKRGRKPSTTTLKILPDDQYKVVENEEVVGEILTIKSNLETDYGYKAMTGNDAIRLCNKSQKSLSNNARIYAPVRRKKKEC